jgi:Ca2+-binding EF-hand superfamily protein
MQMRLSRTLVVPLGLLAATLFTSGPSAAPAPGVEGSLPPQLADQKSQYLKRVIERYTETFRTSDRDGAGRVTRADVGGNVEFLAHFGDIDVNSDGIVTRDELSTYLELHYSQRRD